MPSYKISGTSNEASIIYIIQNEEYVGKKYIRSGAYELLFASSSPSTIIAVAENMEGKIESFGNITPIEADGQEPNLQTARTIKYEDNTLSSVIGSLSLILNELRSYQGDISDELLDGLEDNITKLKSL